MARMAAAGVAHTRRTSSMFRSALAAHISCARGPTPRSQCTVLARRRESPTRTAQTNNKPNERTEQINKQTSEQTNARRDPHRHRLPARKARHHTTARHTHSHATGHAAWREPANQCRCARPTPCHICTGTLTSGSGRRTATWRRVGVKLGHDAEDLTQKRTRPSASRRPVGDCVTKASR